MRRRIATTIILTLCVSISVVAPALPAPAPPTSQVAQVPAYITEWGSFGTGNGQFQTPVGVAVDAAGNVFVCETNGNHIQKFTNTGGYLAQWPGGGLGIAVDNDGNVYATLGRSLAKYSNDGALLAEWPSLGSGLTVDRNGIVYVATRASTARFTSSGTALPEWPDPPYYAADGVAVDANGNVFVVDTYPSDMVLKLRSDGTHLTSWGSDGTGAGQFDTPTRAAVDPSGNVYVVDYGNNRVEIFSNDGGYLGQFGGTGSGPGQFAGPMGIAIDANGFVYVADANNNRIEKFGPLPTPARTSSWGQLKSLYH